MLLIKCPQCNASYRLAESLYRRKAAGFGVVITCRRCKQQIHIDEGSLPPAAGEADAGAPEADVTASPGPLAVTPALPPADPSDPNDDTTDAAVTALPNVAAKAGVPRPGAGVPRPVATQARRGATLLGIPPPANAPSALVAAPTHGDADAGWKPKLVALSPGLLGVGTAAKPAPAAAKKPPDPPEPPPVPDDEAPDSVIPISGDSVQLLDSAVGSEDSPPPDSAVPLDSVDYLSAPDTAHGGPPPPKNAPAAAREKRLPKAPPTRHLPKEAFAGEPKEGDLPSGTGVPKMNELALDATPLPLNHKKGEKQQRRPQPSGDLTDDLLSADLSFDAPPAIAPPDPSALTRAPVSSRPAAASPSVSPGKQRSSTKAPVSKTTGAREKKGSGRGVAILLVMAAFGGVGYALQRRSVPEAPKPEPMANALPPAPEPAPAETATATAAETAAPAPPEPTASAPPEVAAPAVAHGPPPSPGPAPEKTAKAAVAAPVATSDKVATTPTATATPPSSAVIEPRGAAGTEPFDVAAARAALDASAGQASGCRKPGDPSGVAIVTMTFSQTGRVTTANVSGPPFQATPTGGCIASTMRKTRVPAFAGDMVTVRKTVTIQ